MMNPSNPYANKPFGQMPQLPPAMPAQPIQARPMQRPQQIMQPQAEPAKPGGDGGMMGGMLGGMMGGGGGGMAALSDRHSKEQIQKLESANDALTKALSSKAQYPDTGAASSGMQALGQQSAPPSHASFEDAPDSPANKVAAQNVGIQATQPPPQAQGPRPGQSDIRDPWARTQPPNLSALDEAYARMSQGG